MLFAAPFVAGLLAAVLATAPVASKDRPSFHPDDLITPHEGTGSYFAFLGKMARTTAYAHLRINVDVAGIRRNVSTSCQSLQNAVPDKYMEASKIIGHLWKDCDRLLEDFDDQRSIYLARQDSSREKRQIMAFLGGLVFNSIVSAIFGSSSLASLAGGTSEHAVEVMQDHETRVTILEKRVESINHALEYLHDNVAEDMLRLEAQVGLNQFHELESKVRRFMSGWENLFHHRLSPLLVRPESLKAVMARLSLAAQKHDLEMLSVDPEDLFQYPTSHLMTDDGKMIIFVHCPLVPKSGLLNVYRYVGIPMRPPQIDAHIMARPAHSILAINPSNEKFKVMSEQELNECSITKGKFPSLDTTEEALFLTGRPNLTLTLSFSLKGVYFCSRANYYDKRIQDNCLVGLFRASPSTVERACSIEQHPERDAVVALNGTHFALYLAKEASVGLDCSGQISPVKTSRPLIGTFLVHVPPTCTISTDSFVLEGTRLLDSPTVVEGLGISHLGALIPADSIAAMKRRIAEEAASVSASQGTQEVKITDLTKEFRKENQMVTRNLATWVLTAVSALLSVFACCYCRPDGFCRKGSQQPAWRAMFRRNKSPSEQAQQKEISLVSPTTSAPVIATVSPTTAFQPPASTHPAAPAAATATTLFDHDSQPHDNRTAPDGRNQNATLSPYSDLFSDMERNIEEKKYEERQRTYLNYPRL